MIMKNGIKKLLGIIIIIILTATCTVVAQNIINSNEVTYDNSKSKGSFDNVQDSLDELYQKAGYIGEEYHEEILHGADPVLSGELIPIYLADNGDVYYANTYTKWYSYEYKKWANAVILVDDAYGKNRKDNKDKYSVGDKISEEDIESYFVWIPRYAYKLWDLGKTYTSVTDAKNLKEESYADGVGNILGSARIIDITFGTNDYLTGDDYKKLIRNPETGEFSEPEDFAIDQWLVHPAFALGDTQLNGFWMGKFESGYTKISSDGVTSNKLLVKPNISTWVNIKVANIFEVCKDYNVNLKSHMLKNTEWGAASYLSHSKYGKGAEININNASDYKTGYSALNSKEKTDQGESGSSTEKINEEYNKGTGYLASTTGNITGVYDMAGGAWEYVAATMISNRTTDESGFEPETITTEMKNGYIDVYPSNSVIYNLSRRILGDATGEMGPFYSYYDGNSRKPHNSWYSDLTYFIGSNVPWFLRGGAYYNGINAGCFSATSYTGAGAGDRGFRIALAP